jgi:hypothetical protein
MKDIALYTAHREVRLRNPQNPPSPWNKKHPTISSIVNSDCLAKGFVCKPPSLPSPTLGTPPRKKTVKAIISTPPLAAIPTEVQIEARAIILGVPLLSGQIPGVTRVLLHRYTYRRGISLRDTSAAAKSSEGGRGRWGVEAVGRGRLELRESGSWQGIFPPGEVSKSGSSAANMAACSTSVWLESGEVDRSANRMEIARVS